MAGHDWIEIKSYSFPGSVGGDSNDSFIFAGASETGKGGVGGAWDWEVEAESSWTRQDPPDTPTSGYDHHAALPAVQVDDSYAGSHALYQDLFVPH